MIFIFLIIAFFTYLLPCYFVYCKFRHISIIFISTFLIGFIHYFLNSVFGLFFAINDFDYHILLIFFGLDIILNLMSCLLFLFGFTYLSKIKIPSFYLDLNIGYKPFLYVLFLLGILQVFLIAHFNGNILLILEPRNLYQFGRDGYGLFYALGISCYSLFIFFFTLKKRSFISLISVVIPTLLFGSKGFFIYSTIYVLSLHIIHKKKIPINLLLFSSVLLLFGVYFLFKKNFNIIGLSNYFNISYISLSFFNDYFNNDFKCFGFNGLFSEYYKYFPRFIFPDRPLIRGHLFLIDHYYPGAVQSGHTPAFTQFSYFMSDGGFIYAFLRSTLNITPLLSGFAIHKALAFYKKNNFPQVPIVPVIIAIFFYSPQFGKFIPNLYSLILLVILLLPSCLKLFFTNFNTK